MSEVASHEPEPTPAPTKLQRFEMVWTVEYRMPIRAPTAMEAQAAWRRMEDPEGREETRAELTDHEVESVSQCCPHCGGEIEEE